MVRVKSILGLSKTALEAAHLFFSPRHNLDSIVLPSPASAAIGPSAHFANLLSSSTSFLSGKFVSESKFQSNPAAFVPHIIRKDRNALGDLITKPAVERAVLNRLGKKASHYGADIGLDGEVKKSPKPVPRRRLSATRSPQVDTQARELHKVDSPLSSAGTLVDENAEDHPEWKIDVEEVKHLYEKWIIPLTKEVEVRTFAQKE